MQCNEKYLFFHLFDMDCTQVCADSALCFCYYNNIMNFRIQIKRVIWLNNMKKAVGMKRPLALSACIRFETVLLVIKTWFVLYCNDFWWYHIAVKMILKSSFLTLYIHEIVASIIESYGILNIIMIIIIKNWRNNKIVAVKGWFLENETDKNGDETWNSGMDVCPSVVYRFVGFFYSAGCAVFYIFFFWFWNHLRWICIKTACRWFFFQIIFLHGWAMQIIRRHLLARLRCLLTKCRLLSFSAYLCRFF